jgi:hypothetical protein
VQEKKWFRTGVLGFTYQASLSFRNRSAKGRSKRLRGPAIKAGRTGVKVLSWHIEELEDALDSGASTATAGALQGF